ncbi:hypothetical protein [Kineosporia succinea]|uniref:Uncharacterized protein n=1 Tax=Kineosporia succinea TaxID=84632 RepID=A0ABT9P1Q8_9ACTN|nr:hypothetical protein [Kineosporia succinea]MDP9826611.1 hypothetical protein [Kineosporia succinea]
MEGSGWRLRRGDAGRATPDVETVRGWWLDLLGGRRSRAEVGALAVRWGRDERLACPFVRRALRNLRQAARFRADTGAPVRPLTELAAAYETWCADVRLAREDPQAWRMLARDRTLAVLETRRRQSHVLAR